MRRASMKHRRTPSPTNHLNPEDCTLVSPYHIPCDVAASSHVTHEIHLLILEQTDESKRQPANKR
jgi:hypothetical protein